MFFKNRCSVITLVTIFLACFVPTVKGANPDTSRTAIDKQRGGMGYVSIGYTALNVHQINNRLTASGLNYPTLNERYITVGGGGHTVYGRWLIGGEGHGITGSSMKSNSYKVSVDGGYGFFNVGYRIFSNKGFSVAPMLGLGGGGLEMTISQTNEDPAFGEVLRDPERQSTLTSSAFLIQSSVNFSYEIPRFHSTQRRKRNSGITIHVKAGYILAAHEDEWTMSDQKLEGSPSSGLQGPFIRLSVGFGGYGRP